jgi:hypothetical protein
MGLFDSFLNVFGLQRRPASEPQRTHKRKQREPELERERERTRRRSRERLPLRGRAHRAVDVARGGRTVRSGEARFAQGTAAS